MFIPFDHKKQNLLRHLPSEQMYKMLLSGELCIRSYPKDTLIHQASDIVESLEIVIMGEVTMKNHLDDVFREVHLFDAIFYDQVFQDGFTYNYDIFASDDTMLLAINRRVLGDLIFTNSELLREYARLTAMQQDDLTPSSPLS